MKKLKLSLTIFLLIISCTAYAKDDWNQTVNDATGDASFAYDITQVSAWHDGTIFNIKIQLAGQYSTAPYTVYGARIRTGSVIYELAFVTESSFWGPKLGVSYDGGASWGFAGGSPSGSISPTEVNLQIPMSNIGPRPWTVDFITGVWWYFNNYQIMDSTTTVIIPASVTVDNVITRQRTDGSHCVDIYYDLRSVTDNSVTVSILVSDNRGTSYSITPKSISGDIGSGVQIGTGKHIVWDTNADMPGAYSKNCKIALTASN